MTLTAARPAAVIIGAGIGGLAAGASLHAARWDVTVCEGAASLEPVGAGLALAPNGLRALDSPAGLALRDALALALGRLAPAAPLRGLASVYDWHPPAVPPVSHDHENSCTS